MPWKTCKPMDEKLRFIDRLLEGEKMAPLCRELGISRVTGYKICKHYKDSGLDALQERSRRPHRHANQLPWQVERIRSKYQGSDVRRAAPLAASTPSRIKTVCDVCTSSMTGTG